MYFLHFSVTALVVRMASTSIVTADVFPICDSDQHWDVSLDKCVNNHPKTVTMADPSHAENITCLPDQHWDPALRACVNNARIIRMPYAQKVPIMSDHDLDCHQSGCPSGQVCYDYGACQVDCHTAGCPHDYGCASDGICYVDPPGRINVCGDDQHYDPNQQKCVNNRPPRRLILCKQLECASGEICTTSGYCVTDCHTVGCSSGHICAADGICQLIPSTRAKVCDDNRHFDQSTQTCVENLAQRPLRLRVSDCRVKGCPGEEVCENGICIPPANLQKCGSDQHATEHGCVNNGPKELKHVMASMPQAAKSPVLAVDAVCHISLNGATRCCTKTGGICVTGEVEKSDDHVIIPIKDEL